MMLLTTLVCSMVGLSGLVRTPPPFVAVRQQVIAQWVKGRWKDVRDDFGKGKYALSLKEVGIGKIGKTFHAKGIEPNEGVGGATLIEGDGDINVLTYGLKPLVPRPCKRVPLSEAQKIVSSFLRTKGIKKADPKVLDAVRVDLDDDGTTETIIASNSSDQFVTGMQKEDKNGYGLVLLLSGRFSVPLEWSKGGFNRCFLYAIADLDGDGVMEVVSSSAYYEGFQGTLYRWKKGKLAKLATNGSGA